MKPHYETVSVLGVGLLGASFARAIKKASLCGHIKGFGRNEGNLRRAAELGIIDSYSTSAKEACQGADLVVFATPVGSFLQIASQIKGSLKKGALVIDVGSIKGGLVSEMEGLMPDGVKFIGCHPIAGGESSGLGASRAEIFEGAYCIITPTGNTESEAVQAAASLWEAIGSKVRKMTPEDHDRVFALVSHFPHLAAFAMVGAMGKVDEDALKYAGQGFKDSTRIALSSPDLWQEICMKNKDNLINILEVFRRDLDEIEGYLKSGDHEGLKKTFIKARRLRESLGN